MSNVGNRVVITGLGVVSPVGNDVKTVWKNIIDGNSGIDHVTKFDTEQHKVTVGAEVKDFDFGDKREARRLDLFSQYGIAATREALESSGLKINENISSKRVGTYVGTGIGGIMTLEKDIVTGYTQGMRKVSPMLVPMAIGNMAAGNIAIAFGLEGSALDIVTACACGTNCVGEAYRAIKHGYLDAAVAGGTEAPFAQACYAGFSNMKAMNTTDDVTRASIPFDKERSGFIMGEGSAILILEEYERAKSRGANIFAEVVGYGSTCDAYHITSPHPEGEGGAGAMQMAIEDAGITPKDISYINAHGTSTPLNDLYETRAIKKVFGSEAYNTPVSSTKSMTGHMLGAAGAIEALICALSIRDQKIPGTIGYKIPDEELDLDYVTDGSREIPVEYTLSNSLGFGGHNGTIIFKRFQD